MESRHFWDLAGTVLINVSRVGFSRAAVQRPSMLPRSFIEMRPGRRRRIEGFMNRPTKSRKKLGKKYEKPSLQKLGSVCEYSGLLGTSGHDGLTGTSLTGASRAKRVPGSISRPRP